MLVLAVPRWRGAVDQPGAASITSAGAATSAPELRRARKWLGLLESGMQNEQLYLLGLASDTGRASGRPNAIFGHARASSCIASRHLLQLRPSRLGPAP
jgi:hypothetical protein